MQYASFLYRVSTRRHYLGIDGEVSITNGYKQKSLKSEELSNDSYLFS